MCIGSQKYRLATAQPLTTNAQSNNANKDKLSGTLHWQHRPREAIGGVIESNTSPSGGRLRISPETTSTPPLAATTYQTQRQPKSPNAAKRRVVRRRHSKKHNPENPPTQQNPTSQLATPTRTFNFPHSTTPTRATRGNLPKGSRLRLRSTQPKATRPTAELGKTNLQPLVKLKTRPNMTHELRIN